MFRLSSLQLRTESLKRVTNLARDSAFPYISIIDCSWRLIRNLIIISQSFSLAIPSISANLFGRWRLNSTCLSCKGRALSSCNGFVSYAATVYHVVVVGTREAVWGSVGWLATSTRPMFGQEDHRLIQLPQKRELDFPVFSFASLNQISIRLHNLWMDGWAEIGDRLLVVKGRFLMPLETTYYGATAQNCEAHCGIPRRAE